MNILTELRYLKGKVQQLQANQKEVEQRGAPAGTGMLIEYDPVQRIGMLEMEVEQLYLKLIDAQSKVINGQSNDY